MSPPTVRPLTIMLVAGEPSGDALGADLVTALREIEPDHDALRLVGVGGPLMRARGFVPLYGLEDTSVMGLREVVPKIPAILRRVRQAAAFAERVRPDVVVLIDSPDFTHRIARAIRKRDPNLKIVKYVAPQVWASRSYRAKQMATYTDHVLCLLPFEPAFFEAAGVTASFVGHPVIERRIFMKDGAAYRTRHSIAADAPLLLVLPGSRSSEIRFILPVFRETVRRLAAQHPDLVCVLPTLTHLRERIAKETAGWPSRLIVTQTASEKFESFDAATAALAASGTVTTELALARCPMIVAYRVGALTAWIARRLINVPFVTLVNLILKEGVVPEFIQEDCTPERLEPAVAEILFDETARQRQCDGFEKVASALGEGDERPSLRAARVVLSLVGARALPAS